MTRLAPLRTPTRRLAEAFALARPHQLNQTLNVSLRQRLVTNPSPVWLQDDASLAEAPPKRPIV